LQRQTSLQRQVALQPHPSAFTLARKVFA
jgi:hypothetical protein